MSVATSADWNAVRHLKSYHRAAPVIAKTIASVRDDADGTGTRPAASIFRAAATPPVSIARYLMRLIKYSGCEPSVLVTMFILLDRFARRADLNSRCVHRVMAAAFVAAVLLGDDGFRSYGFYARVCGLQGASEVQELVCAFLSGCDFELDISARDYARTEQALFHAAA
eukprot:TRINITY_DN574_c0_g2_i1.p3 TRINITY_DN574_c0_g2~~TRINITY_DN574_c0_g2_i1.p3  ORF type:complete len:195 (+),score=61.80 TRINITY_DN574_c0_g2_i1:79-585(+)